MNLKLNGCNRNREDAMILRTDSKRNEMSLKILSKLVLTAVAVLFASGPSWAESNEYTFTVGKITLDPRQQYEKIYPMADYLANELSDYGYEAGAVLMTQDVEKMAQAMTAGEVDLVTTTLFEALWLIDSGAGELAAIKWKDGVSHYASVLASLESSRIGSLDDLIGKNVTFEDQNSTSGFFVPFVALTETTDNLHEVSASASDSENRLTDSITYQFSYSKKNTVDWLLNGKTDAVALSDEGLQDLMSDFPAGPKFKLVYSSTLIPRAMEVMRKDLSAEKKSALVSAIHSMHLDSAATEALMHYHQTSRMTRPTPADEQLIMDYKVHLERVRAAIE